MQTICTSLQTDYHTTPAPRHSIFTGRMLFLAPNQQCQSTERTLQKKINVKQSKCYRLFCFACIGLFYFTCVFPHISFHVWGQTYWHCSHRMWQGLCNGRVSVSSVCLYQLSTAAAACGGFAAGRPAGRRNSSIAARPGFQTATAPQQHGAQRQTRALPRSEPP